MHLIVAHLREHNFGGQLSNTDIIVLNKRMRIFMDYWSKCDICKCVNRESGPLPAQVHPTRNLA